MVRRALMLVLFIYFVSFFAVGALPSRSGGRSTLSQQAGARPAPRPAPHPAPHPAPSHSPSPPGHIPNLDPVCARVALSCHGAITGYLHDLTAWFNQDTALAVRFGTMGVPVTGILSQLQSTGGNFSEALTSLLYQDVSSVCNTNVPTFLSVVECGNCPTTAVTTDDGLIGVDVPNEVSRDSTAGVTAGIIDFLVGLVKVVGDGDVCTNDDNFIASLVENLINLNIQYPAQGSCWCMGGWDTKSALGGLASGKSVPVAFTDVLGQDAMSWFNRIENGSWYEQQVLSWDLPTVEGTWRWNQAMLMQHTSLAQYFLNSFFGSCPGSKPDSVMPGTSSLDSAFHVRFENGKRIVVDKNHHAVDVGATEMVASAAFAGDVAACCQTACDIAASQEAAFGTLVLTDVGFLEGYLKKWPKRLVNAVQDYVLTKMDEYGYTVFGEPISEVQSNIKRGGDIKKYLGFVAFLFPQVVGIGLEVMITATVLMKGIALVTAGACSLCNYFADGAASCLGEQHSFCSGAYY